MQYPWLLQAWSTLIPQPTAKILRTPIPDLESPDLVIIGTSIDPHIDAVIASLPGVNIARLDVDRFPSQQRLAIRPIAQSHSRLALFDGDNAWNISRPTVAWFRRMGAPGLASSVSERYRQFALGEAEHALEAVNALMQPRRWLNEYWSCRRAANKPFQYSLAQSVGLVVPETLITNDIVTAKDWLSTTVSPIVKSLHSPVVVQGDHRDRRLVFTSSLSERDKLELDDVVITPCQFQPQVGKQFEVRVTSIAQRHFAMRIDAGGDSLSTLDWRDETFDCVFSMMDIDVDVQSQLDRLFGCLNLDFGASDFIVTPSGEWIFLEVNPHGAWLWLEQEERKYSVTSSFASVIEEELASA